MEVLAGKMLGFMLILTRIGAFYATSPLFSWQAIPVRSKVTIGLLSAVFFAGITPCQFTTENTQLLQIILLMANEFLYGLAMGIVAYCIFAVVRVAGRIIERQMGLTMANVMDPLTGQQGQPLGMLLEIFFIFLVFSTDTHHLLLQILGRSFYTYSPGFSPDAAVLLESVLRAGSALFMLALQMAAPMLAAFLLLMVVLAFMARMAPEANILFLSMPLRCGIGLLMMGVFIPFLANFIKVFTTWVDRLLPF
ncbi:MAG: flagellar biosynthetic protein FliR [Planctomycetota bacterium]|jgi:flagellar biosynthetic protein FliR